MYSTGIYIYICFVSQTYYKYPSFILYQAVRIFDFYIDTVEVGVDELQIVALAALWIALKKDLITGDIPEVYILQFDVFLNI